MNGLTVAIADGFLNAFSEIPRPKQKKVMEFLGKFRLNPKSPGINYEKINDAKDQNFRSVRIDQDYRGIVLQPETGDVYVLLWVDKHDAAYTWARRHRCDIHPQTGALQLLPLHDGSEEEASPIPVPSSKQKEPTPQAPLFELDDATLLRFGVPIGDLGRVRALCTVDELENAEKWLPREAFDALYLLAAGTPLAEVLSDCAPPVPTRKIDTDDFAVALDNDVSKQRFHVVDSELELIEMLEAPLEKWRVFLHPSQRQLVDRTWNGPVRVLGGAGTGKTVVAMHRAKWLAQHVVAADERVLFTTFTANLATDIEENLRKICAPELMQRIHVCHIDKWIADFFKRQQWKFDIAYEGDDRYEACWTKAEQIVPGALDLPLSFYREEWTQVILPQSIRCRDDYLAARRTGRGTPVSRKQRAEAWPVFEEMRLQMDHLKLVTIEDAAKDVITFMKTEGPKHFGYRSIIVDEAQDLSGTTFELLRSLTPEQPNDLFIVGDPHQRIYRRKAVLGQCGINVRGRGKSLRLNYRTTEEIRRFAVSVLENVPVDDLDAGQGSLKGYRSLMHGQSPEKRKFSSLEQELDWLRDTIEDLRTEGYQEPEICIVVRTNNLVKEYAAGLNRFGVSTHQLSRTKADTRKSSGVRVATMHRVKGLEFKVMFLASINRGLVPLELRSKTQDPVEAQMHDANERSLFHVAATRAVKRLYISSYGNESEFLAASVRKGA